MPNGAGVHWLLRKPTDPAHELATRIVEKNGIEVPIPIADLVARVADVSEEDWPYEQCDALVVGLGRFERPRIFLRRAVYGPRKLFTLAHEYGHVCMGWHIGQFACHPEPGESTEITPLNPGVRARIATLVQQEDEATRFASTLLIPDGFVRPLVETGDMNLVLTELNRTRASCPAILMRLKDILQPGFRFAYPAGPSRKIFTSPGTAFPARPRESGTVRVAGQEVHWARFVDFSDPLPVEDVRTTSDLLRSAIAAAEADEGERLRLFRSIQGVAAGCLSKDRADTTNQALAILRQKFASLSEHNSVTQHTDFDLFMRRKACERIEKKRGK